MLPYKSTHRSSIAIVTFQSCCKHARGGFGSKKIIKIVLTGVLGVALQEPHIHPIAMKLSQVVVNILTMVLEKCKKLKIVLAGVSSVALHSNLDEILHES